MKKRILCFGTAFFLVISVLSCGGGGGSDGDDNTSLTPGNNGIITADSITDSSMILNWGAASDPVDYQTDLIYAVYRSLSDDIGTAAECESNGTRIMDFTAHTTAYNVTGLDSSSTYYFNVIVVNNNNDKAAYVMKQVSTTAIPDNTAPVPGNSGTISTGTITQVSAVLNWTAATDNMTEQSSLQYAVYCSLSNNISTVSDCEANGTRILDYTSNAVTYDVTGLTAGTSYYFNVIVKDSAGNKAVYTTKSASTGAAVIINWVRLRWPPDATGSPEDELVFYGEVYAPGSTDHPGQGPGITAQFGIGPRDTIATHSSWQWFAAIFNTENGDNDEYLFSLTLPSVGNYDYVFRFSGDGGVNWVYGDVLPIFCTTQ